MQITTQANLGRAFMKLLIVDARPARLIVVTSAADGDTETATAER
jgi:hypothetical protein